ncbi:glycoside hydrolase family 27 protein [Rathayibacter soli]|uniref:glycoside hydrolase family 27 protein n=1 Tax=Rathayibacter soli TaxID=3144168 RepID=UPI0027E55D70|nr:glycoside hydrolase family 27 protein [Glaciibacter superstes]
MRLTAPPMGWNSWDCFGTTVTEAEVRANATFMRDRLSAFGWNVVVVDIAWYDPAARAHGYNADAPIELDRWGRQFPAPNRFPSSVDSVGFAALAHDVHAMGLDFGLHIMRGIPRRAVELDLPVFGTDWTASQIADRDRICPWNPDNYGLNHEHPGAQAYYDAQVAQFAAWGVDLIKADDMLAPIHPDDILAYARAIERSGRPIALSSSPGTGLSTRHIDLLRETAQMWRISDDLWDRWDDIHAQFARLARWAPFQHAAGWADADILPLGRIGVRAERGEPRSSMLTSDEQRTMLTLWAMARSPLMLGADLPQTNASTIALLCNPALRDALSFAAENAEVVREPAGDGEEIAWSAPSTRDSRVYAALFFTGSTDRTVSIPIGSLVGPTPASRSYRISDLWGDARTATIGVDGRLEAAVAPHGVRWFALDTEPA